jgi:hypothetical protein
VLDAASIAADLAEIVADLPVACAFGGVSFSATSTDAGSARTVEIDGELYSVDRTIVCNAAHVASTIKGDDQITVGGVSYRVLDVSRHPDGVGLEINLKAVTQ